MAALATPLLAGCGAGDAQWHAGDTGGDGALRGMVLPRPIEKPDFILNDTDGKPFDFRAETDGYLTLLFFGYTYCPDVCPVHMASLAAVLDGMPVQVRNRIKVVFVSVDPERDTPERIREWLNAFDRRFIGLRGTSEEVEAIMRSLQLPTAVLEEPDEKGRYLVGHPSQVIAFEPDGPARVIYPFGTRQADWAYDLPRLVGAAAALHTFDAYVAEPATPDRTALYISIENDGTVDDELIAVSVELAGRTEIHRTVQRGGLMRMEPVTGVRIPAGGRTRLIPGGYHIMLLDLKSAPKAGDTIEAELTFRRAGRRRIQAEVRTYAELESLLEPAAAQTAQGRS